MKRGPIGEVVTLVLVGILLLGGGVWGLSKTAWFHGDTKRAETSTTTTNEVLAALDKRGAVAAASVVKIGEANTTAPESPEKVFIGREVPVALASLPPPDVEALMAAERRKAAVLEGGVAEANKLYGTAMERADQYQKEATRAIAAKRASDLALEQAAAEARGAEQQQFWFGLIAVACLAGWAYTKISHVSPGALASAVADMRNGTSEPNTAIAALDSALSPIQQKMIKANVWLHKKLTKLTE